MRGLTRQSVPKHARTLPVEPGGALDTMLRASELSLVDVGARGKPRREFRLLAPYAHLFGCEPEPEEAERLVEELKLWAPWRDVTVITEALGTVPGRAPLYVTSSPGMTSLLRPDPDVVGRYASPAVFDVVSTTDVPIVRLDEAARRYGFEDACFLKLDTQGTELDIMRSGEELVCGPVLGVYLEANFHAFYEGQPVFADVDAYLRERGYMLADMQRAFRRTAGHRTDIASRAHVVWSHCLYLRRPDLVAAVPGPDFVRRAARYVAITLAYEHHDLAWNIVSNSPTAERLAEVYGSGLVEELDRYLKQFTDRAVRRTEGDPSRLFASAYKE